jgi:hypothetical protein
MIKECPLPCPFCGSVTAPHAETDAEIEYKSEEDSTGYYAVCCNACNGGCGATGGFKPTEAEALAAWNARGFEAGQNAREQWVSVETRMPEDDVDVLVSDGETIMDGERYRGEWWVHGCVTGCVTHWQPLPSPPT